jgi:hypothetical protein
MNSSIGLKYIKNTPFLSIGLPSTSNSPVLNGSLLVKIQTQYPVSSIISSVNLDLPPTNSLVGFYEWQGPAKQPVSAEFLGNKLASSMTASTLCSLALIDRNGLVARFKYGVKDQFIKLDVPSLNERLTPMVSQIDKIEAVSFLILIYKELAPMKSEKIILDQEARSFAVYSTWIGLAMLSAQLGYV